EPRAAWPGVIGGRLRQYRNEREVRIFRLPAAGYLRHVQIALRARAPVQHDLARNAVMEHVLDDRLDRREPGAARDEDHRLVGILAQIERAERTLEAQDLASLVGREQRIGEEA